MSLGSRYRERSLEERDDKRKLIAMAYPEPLGYYREYQSGTLSFEQPMYFTGYVQVPRFQRTWDEIHSGPPWREGGPFSSVRIEYPRFTPKGAGKYRRTVGSTVYEYEGAFFCPDVGFDPFSVSTLSNTGWGFDQDNSLLPDINSWGPSVYPALRPQLSMANMSVALLEAKDMVGAAQTSGKHFADLYRGILKSRPGKGGFNPMKHPFMDPKWVADEFLNNVFGWIPFLKDVHDIHNADLKGQQFMDDLSKKNGRWEKRTRTLEDIVEDWNMIHSQWGYMGCQPLGHLMENVFPVRRFDVYHRKVSRVWAEGLFRFFLPEFDRMDPKYGSMMSGIKREMMLYGLRINPLVLYKATPWTWALDWFTGIGNLIARVQDYGLDGIVSKNCYLMQHVRHDVFSYHTLAGFDGGSIELRWDRTFETKQRIAADSPYGFGLSWNGLSPRQLAILAALGISNKKGGDRTL